MIDGIMHANRDEGNNKGVRLRVFRANRAIDQRSHRYQNYTVPVKKWTTVLDALLHIKYYIDSTVAIRYSCRMASCGSCGMKINGIPRLACYTKISELPEDTITCEPLSNFPLIRDLVTDFSQFFQHHKEMQPYLEPDSNGESETESGYIQTPEQVDKYLQFSYCIKCGLCYSACPTVATDTKFPGPQALTSAYRYFADSRDKASGKRLKVVDDRHGIWRCHLASSCSHVCPKGVDPALGIALLKGYLLGYSKRS